MKKQTIIPIIVLMAVAMIGITILQGVWIKRAIDLKRDGISTAVTRALHIVADRLENDEQAKSTNPLGSNGFETRYYQQQITFNDQQTRTRIQNTLRFGREPLAQKSLSDRITIVYLNSWVKEAIADSGINMDYDWAVYSRVHKQYVIKNGNWQVPGQQTAMGDLRSSPFKVNLFRYDNPLDGQLQIFFPALANILWESVLQELLISLALICVILFCFGYVVQVIYRQKKLSEMKTDFINNMTHEFKTPIATISLAADSITSPMIMGNDEKVKRFADIIRQENKRMNSQVEKVLQMAMLDKDDFELKVTEINMHDVVEQAVRHLSLQVEKKDGQILTELNATNPMIKGDLTHISNIIHNLLDNANKYTPDTPEIKVITNNVASGVEVIISDNGIGMSKEVRKHIFDKFYREHTGDIHNVKGFGLGLSYVKRMMTAHKGQVDVKSEKGVGSSFILVFPHDINN